MKNVRIIHTNDIHSKYEEFLRMAYIIDKYKDENSLLLDAGDFNDFSSFITFGTNGYAGLKLLNMLGYSALTIGNNEGFQDIDVIEKTCEYNLINILSCNLFKIDGSQIKGLKKSIISEVNNVRFLIIGVSPFYQSYNEFYNLYDLKAIEPYEIIKNEIKVYQGQYDFVILLSHLGLETDLLIPQKIENIDLIISGHSHHAINCIQINNTFIHQSGVRGSHVGILDLTIKNNKIVGVNDKNIEISDKTPINEIINQEYLKQKEEALNNLSKTILTIERDLTYSIDSECDFTNLVADYLFNKYKCDLSLISSGLTASNLKKRNISYKDILDVCNSPLEITTMDIKGKYIIEAIKESMIKEKCFDSHRRAGFRGDFLGKIHISYNCEIISNNDSFDIYINNKIIENEKYYTVVTTDYFYRGMGYSCLKNNINGKIYKETIVKALINALKDKNNYKFIDCFRYK